MIYFLSRELINSTKALPVIPESNLINYVTYYSTVIHLNKGWNIGDKNVVRDQNHPFQCKIISENYLHQSIFRFFSGFILIYNPKFKTQPF